MFILSPVNKSEIAQFIKSIFEDILCRPVNYGEFSAQVVGELLIDTDDISFIIIPKIQKKYHLEIPKEEWMRIRTIQDTINLIDKYVNSNK